MSVADESDRYMTRAELKELIGRTQPAAQIRWLKTNGVVYYVRADGHPRVPKDEKGHPIPTGHAKAVDEEEPNFGVLRAARVG